jgi:probable HAF family extracellular repeat protein
VTAWIVLRRAAMLMTRILVLLNIAIGMFPVAALAQYRLQVLGTFDGRPTFASAINDDRVVVGNTWDGSGNQVPMIWSAATGFRRVLGDVNGMATDINNRGQVVGWYMPGGVNSEWHGFLWSEKDGLLDLGTRFVPARINDGGVIAGTCTPPDGWSACVWNGALTSLPASYPQYALAISAAGDVVGYALPGPSDNEMPFAWRHDAGLRQLPVVPDAVVSLATDVNAAGTIVGWSWLLTGGGRHTPVMWNAAGSIVANTPDINGIFTAINDAGVVVGESPAVSSLQARGFTWGAGGRPVFLPGGDASEPTDINSHGVVTGVIYEGTRSLAAIWMPDTALRIATPNTPARWGAGSRQRIACDYSGDAAQFQIDVSRDQGRT